MPSCGECHAATPGMGGVDVDVALSARSLTPGQAITVTTSATGGQDRIDQRWVLKRGHRGGVQLRGQLACWARGPRHHAPEFVHGRARLDLRLHRGDDTVNGDILPGPEDWWAFHGGDGLTNALDVVSSRPGATGLRGWRGFFESVHPDWSIDFRRAHGPAPRGLQDPDRPDPHAPSGAADEVQV